MTITKHINHYKSFYEAHSPGNPLILPNIWDVSSLKEVEPFSQFLGTTSYGIAESQGYPDGENLPFSASLGLLEKLTQKSRVPLSYDFEAGFAEDDKTFAENTVSLMRFAIVGINVEDKLPKSDQLLPIDHQCQRIEIIQNVCQRVNKPLFINARTDLFFLSPKEDHATVLDEALRRAHHYKNAGAHGFFVPGLEDHDVIRQLCQRSPLPVNIMQLNLDVGPHIYARLGVSRISFGPALFLDSLRSLKAAMTAYGGTHDTLSTL